jgi:hypothetical protein
MKALLNPPLKLLPKDIRPADEQTSTGSIGRNDRVVNARVIRAITCFVKA